MNPNRSLLEPGYHDRTVATPDGERHYLVYTPVSLSQNAEAPVVLAFHGGGVNAASMVEFSGLSTKADQASFLLVYPSGSGRVDRFLTWNGGNCCGYAKKYNIDDVGFVDAMLDDLAEQLPIDQRRIYATGMSNGGVMSYRLADRLSHRIAAIAPVAGVTGSETVAPKRPVPICHFHGTADDFVRWDGGVGEKSLSRTDFLSVDHTINIWKNANQCTDAPAVTIIHDGADDQMPIDKQVYSGDAPIHLYRIEGGGHTWPGRIPQLEKLGPSTTTISANDLIWDFFSQHKLP